MIEPAEGGARRGAGGEAARAPRARPARPRAPEPARRSRSRRSPSISPQLAEEAVGRHEAEARRVGVSLARRVDRRRARRRPTRTGCCRCSSNLIENAVRSTPAGGSVTVTAEPGELTRRRHRARASRPRTCRARSSASTSTAATPRTGGRHRPRPGDREGADRGDGGLGHGERAPSAGGRPSSSGSRALDPRRPSRVASAGPDESPRPPAAGSQTRGGAAWPTRATSRSKGRSRASSKPSRPSPSSAPTRSRQSGSPTP